MPFSRLNVIMSAELLRREFPVTLKPLLNFFILIIAFSFLSNDVLADKKPVNSISQTDLKKLVENRFKSVLERIDNTLLNQHQSLKAEHKLLKAFVNDKILPYWDIELTLRLLVGSKTWKSLKPEEIQKLKDAFVNTMHRYVQEGINLYDGQRASFVEAQLSNKGKTDKGQITILLEPIYLPSFHIHFKVANRGQEWLLYDVFVEGVSYVKLKKNEYRQVLHQKGVDGLLAHLESKNYSVVEPNKLTAKPNEES